MKIKKILVPVDFSPSSNKALSCALVFARKYQAKLFILACSEGYVIDPEVIKGHPDSTDQQTQGLLKVIKAQSQKETEERLSKFLEESFGEELPDHERLVVYGTPYEEIIRTAKKFKMDMIILGTMGRTGIERLLLGSTAEKVVRLAHCPVMTVRREE